VSETYTAVLTDPDDPDRRTVFPGVFFQLDGSPAQRVRLRYESPDGEARVTDFALVGPHDDGRYEYARSADGPYEPGPPDDADWIVDAPGPAAP
jgi:hypothetical protein